MFEIVDITSLEDQGFIGAIACDAGGSVIEATSDDLEVFGSVLGYMSQIAEMIGEPFGMDSVEEIHLESSNTQAICIPQEDGCLGVLCNSRANIEGILGELLN